MSWVYWDFKFFMDPRVSRLYSTLPSSRALFLAMVMYLNMFCNFWPSAFSHMADDLLRNKWQKREL